MKLLPHLLMIAGLLTASVVHAEEKDAKAADVAMPVYATAAQLKAMPPTKGAAEVVDSYSAILRTADGKQIKVGSDRGEQQVWHFVNAALRKGATCELPAEFLAYAEAKYYATADAIKAMPACKATLVGTSPCSSTFRTADGKWFTLGDPGSKPDVYLFLHELADGQSYELPGAFLEFHKKK